jgi:hypothetical protein
MDLFLYILKNCKVKGRRPVDLFFSFYAALEGAEQRKRKVKLREGGNNDDYL